MAKIVMGGGQLYHDAVDLKPPLIYYTYAAILSFFDNMIFLHFVTMLWVLCTCLVIYKIFKMTRHKDTAWCGAILYALFSAAFWPKAAATNCEIIMNLPIVFAILFYFIYYKERKKHYCFLSGIFIALAGLFKYQALLIVPAFIMVEVFCLIKNKSFWKFLKSGLLLSSGFVIVYILLISYYHFTNNLHHAFFWAWDYNFIFLKGFTWSYFYTAFSRAIPKFILLWIVLWISIIIYITKIFKNRKLDCFDVFCIPLFICSICAVMIGGKFFGHYFIQLLLPSVFLAAPEVFNIVKDFSLNNITNSINFKKIIIIMVIISVPLFSLCRSWRERIRAYAEDETIIKISESIEQNSNMEDKIFCWGIMPELFVHTKRLPASRFVASNFLVGKNTYNNYISASKKLTLKSWNFFKKDLMLDLEKNRPRIIVDTSTGNWKNFGFYQVRNYPELVIFIEKNYSKISVIDKMVIYSYKHKL